MWSAEVCGLALLPQQRRLRTPEEDPQRSDGPGECRSIHQVAIGCFDHPPTVLDEQSPTLGVALLRCPRPVGEERTHLQRHSVRLPGEVGLHPVTVADRHPVVRSPTTEAGLVKPATDALLLSASVADPAGPRVEKTRQKLATRNGGHRHVGEEITDRANGRNPSGKCIVETTLNDPGIGKAWE